MALSAYKRGLLKKHPLLGTSFLVDPSMAQGRARFMELHKQAGSEGRAGMLSRLASEYRQFGDPLQSRIREIESAKGSLMYGSPERNDLEREEVQNRKYLQNRAILYNAFLGG